MSWTSGQIARTAAALLGVAAVAASCTTKEVPAPDKQPLGAAPAATTSPPNGLTAEAAAHLDSANVAYRAKQYDVALTHYRAAAQAAPDHAAPWYGVFMVGEATQNKALADSAQAMVAQRSPGSGLTDSAMANAHGGGGGAAAGALPPGHPTTETPALPPGHPTPSKPMSGPATKGSTSGM